MPQRFAYRPRVDRGHLDSAPDADLEDPARVERAHRLANDRPGDAELLPEFTFRGKRVARLQVVGDDRLDDVVGDAIGEARLPRESPEPGSR
jgi:hypothetical protein